MLPLDELDGRRQTIRRAELKLMAGARAEHLTHQPYIRRIVFDEEQLERILQQPGQRRRGGRREQVGSVGHQCYFSSAPLPFPPNTTHEREHVFVRIQLLRGGSRTTLSQKFSIDFTTAMNCCRLRGLVM